MRVVRAAGLVLLLLPAGCASPTSTPSSSIVWGGARFTVATPECIRIEYSAAHHFVDDPSLFAADREARAPVTVERSGRGIVLDTGRIRLQYLDDGRPLTSTNLRAEIRGGAEPILWTPGMENRGNLGGTLKALGPVRGPVDLGQGLLSRDGWYLLDDSSTPLLTSAGWVAARQEKDGTDWYLFGYGRNYRAALRALTAVGGAVPLPRRAALGSWYSWYWPLDSADYRRIAEEYRDHGLPLDVMVLDMDWHAGGWTGWDWNRRLLPDAEALVAWLHKRGLTVALNVHPSGGVGPDDSAYAGFMSALGADPSTRRTLPFDASDRRYLDAFFRFTHDPLERAGVDFFWVDWQQQPMTRGVPGLTNLAWLNDRYYRRSARDGRRGQILSRWAGWGDHRNVIHFSGDAEGLWSVLRFEVPFTSTAGNVGCFFWSHDIGGHRGSRDPELVTRWVEFGAVSAALRLHAARSQDLDRRPWSFEKPYAEAMRDAFLLRARLFPYLYTTAWQAHADSLPLLRPMYLEFPEDDRAYANPQEYLLGDAFLVAPIVEPGVGPGRLATQTVWFPAGRWRDWSTGEVHEGGTEEVVAASLDEIPLYVREGVPVPTQAPGDRMDAGPPAELIVRCYPGAPGHFTLHEDDGLTTAYREGAFASTDLSCARDGQRIEVTIDAPKGTFRGQPRERGYLVELPGTARGRAASIDGVPAAAEYDEATATNRIRVPARALSGRVTVALEAGEADPAALRDRAVRRRVRAALGDVPPEQVRDETLLGAAWAARGLAVQRKNEGLYLRGGPDLIVVHDGAGVLDRGAVLTLEEEAGSSRRVLLRHEVKGRGDIRLAMPDVPAAESSPVGVPLILSVRLRLPGSPHGTVLRTELDRRPSALRAWSVVGPFPYEPDRPLASQVFGPEAPTLDLGATYSGAGGATLSWKEVSCRADGAVDLGAMFGRRDGIAYAATFLRSPRPQPLALRVWSDDGIEIWLNGARIHLNDVVRALVLGPDLVRAELRAGVNVLEVKVSNVALGWAFRVEAETGEGLAESPRRRFDPRPAPPASSSAPAAPKDGAL